MQEIGRQVSAGFVGLLLVVSMGTFSYGERGDRPVKLEQREGSSVQQVAPAMVADVRTYAPIMTMTEFLDASGYGTMDDHSRLLAFLLPRSVKILSHEQINVTDLWLESQNVMVANRGDVQYFVPDEYSSEEVGPKMEVALFEGQIRDVPVTGRMFVSQDQLILDLMWWDAGGRILLAEFYQYTILSTTSGTGSVAGGKTPPVQDDKGSEGGGAARYCKCSNYSGACSNSQCDSEVNCYTGDNHCYWAATSE